jgi:hypothetical protein
MTARPVFTYPWVDLRSDKNDYPDRRTGLADELYQEVGPGHVLHGRRVTVVGESYARDDIVVEVSTGGWAYVHLTWKQAVDQPPWPSTTLYESLEALQRVLDEEAAEYDAEDADTAADR